MKNYKLINYCITIVVLTMALSLPGCVSTNETHDNSAQIEKLKEENALLKRQINILRRELRSSARGKPSFLRGLSPTISFGSNPVLGSTKATIALVEFSDYFCPYCSRFHRTTFDLIKKNYIDNGKLLYVYRDFPRGLAGKAIDAAIAANCAGKQGAFWKMQKILFRYAPAINHEFYKSTAVKLGLDSKKYDDCLNSDQQRSAVKRDFSYGRALGIRGTPTFYVGRVSGNKIINAITIVGAQPYAKFSQTFDRLLATRTQP